MSRQYYDRLLGVQSISNNDYLPRLFLSNIKRVDILIY